MRCLLAVSLPRVGGGTRPNRKSLGLTWSLAPPISRQTLYSLETWRETHLSTIAARPQAAPRLPRAHGDHGRPQGAGTAQGQGTQASVGLIGRERESPASKVTAIGRLKTRAEFLHVREGSRFAAPSLVLQARARGETKAASPDIARFGFTASKALGGAVMRNRARRRLKEAVQDRRPGSCRPRLRLCLDR